ncbi:MAG: response regulator [Synechococcales cyanobacterium RM1_1_8]|nr:response regulator [Synechococcales cyanobacterium RM1_1_8]
MALTVMLKRQQISRENATALVEMTLLEVLFDILQAAPQLEALTHTTDRQPRLGEPVAIFSLAELLGRAQASLAAWQALGLGQISPNLAPIVKNQAGLEQVTSPKTYSVLSSLLKGRLSFRDLTVIMRHDLETLSRSLVNYMRHDLVALKSFPDLESPDAGSNQPVPSQIVENLPLVFCIDDSPQICYILEETLRSAGYRCRSIQDSIQALPSLIRHRPSLIFLDLIMPVANGYEICSQIRRVASLRKIPVIILTGNDGVVDRMRAKAVGATDFMAKPVDSERVIQLVKRYVQGAAESGPAG